jgi:trimeric autotransporter adhesin
MTVEPRSGRISSLWARTPEVQTGAFSESVQAWRRREARRQTGASELSARSVVDIGQGGSKLSETGEQDGGGSSVLRMLSASFAGLTALTILSLAQASADTFSVTYQPMSEANGTVTAVAKVGGSVYLAGRFNYFGLHTGGAAFATEANATPSLAFPSFDGGVVSAAADDGQGGYYVAGTFKKVGGNAISNLAHILSSGAVDTSFHPNPDHQVECLGRSGTSLYVGGEFTTLGGQARGGLAAIDTQTGTVTPWNPATYTNNCFDIAPIGAKVYFAGTVQAGGSTLLGLVEFSASGTGAVTANLVSDTTVTSLALTGSTLYVADFDAPSVFAIDTTSDLTTSWSSGLSDPAYELAVDGGTVYAQLRALGASADHIAAVSAVTGTSLPAWDGAVDRSLLGAGGGVVYTGKLSPGFSGSTASVVEARNGSTGALTSWQLSVEAEPFFVRVLNGHVVTGGAFIEAGGGARQGFAELDPSTGLPTSFAPTTTSDSDVSAIAVDGTTMYVGGEFSSFGGAARAGLAAFDTSTHSNLSWAPQLACSFCVGFNANATKLAAAGGRVYFSGQFDSVNGIAHRDVAGVDGSTGALLPFDPHGSFRTIKALAASSTAVYVGGVFTTLGGASRNNLAALDPTTGAATTWNPSPNGAINAIALSGDSVYLSGSFGQIAGVNRHS